MKLQQVPRKVVERLSTHAFRLLGWDNISSAKISRRKDLKEIGTKYGGWVVPTKLLDTDPICYPVGCGEDIYFDIGLIEQFGCDIFAFDPTPRAIEYVGKVAGQNSQYRFFDVGLWDQENTLKFYAPINPDHVSHSFLNLSP